MNNNEPCHQLHLLLLLRCAKIHKRFRKRCSKDHKCRVLRLDTIYCSIKRLKKKKKPPACLLTPFHRSTRQMAAETAVDIHTTLRFYLLAIFFARWMKSATFTTVLMALKWHESWQSSSYGRVSYWVYK